MIQTSRRESLQIKTDLEQVLIIAIPQILPTVNQSRRAEQDDRVGGSCAHLSLQTHQNYNHIQRTGSENDLKISRKYFPQPKIKSKSYNETARRGRDAVQSEPTPWVERSTSWGYQSPRGLPQGMKGPNPALGSPALGRPAPITSSFKTSTAHMRESQGAVGNRLCLKGTCTDSLIPSPSAEAAVRKAPGSYKKEIPLIILGRVLKEQGSVGIVSRYKGARGHQFFLPVLFGFLAHLIVSWPGAGKCHFWLSPSNSTTCPTLRSPIDPTQPVFLQNGRHPTYTHRHPHPAPEPL